jgi:hypothetical protein
MAECVLDANVLVAWMDSADSLHVRAQDLMAKLEKDGTEPVLLDILVAEAVSVLCRRFRERRQRGNWAAMLAELRRRIDPSTIQWVGKPSDSMDPSSIKSLQPQAGSISTMPSSPFFRTKVVSVKSRPSTPGSTPFLDSSVSRWPNKRAAEDP